VSSRDLEQEEPLLSGSDIRPIDSMPRTCRMPVNSPGTVFAASRAHSAESGESTEPCETDCTCSQLQA